MTSLSVQEWDCGEWEAGRAASGVVGCAGVGRRAESDGDEVVVAGELYGRVGGLVQSASQSVWRQDLIGGCPTMDWGIIQ